MYLQMLKPFQVFLLSVKQFDDSDYDCPSSGSRYRLQARKYWSRMTWKGAWGSGPARMSTSGEDLMTTYFLVVMVTLWGSPAENINVVCVNLEAKLSACVYNSVLESRTDIVG